MLAFSYLCCPVKACCLLNRQRKTRVQLLEKGASRFEESLDIVKIIKQSDVFRNILKLTLTNAQKALILNQRNYLLELSDEGDEPETEMVEINGKMNDAPDVMMQKFDSDEDINQIMCNFFDTDGLQQFEGNPNDFISSINPTFKKHRKAFIQKLKNQDLNDEIHRKMLKGLYKR